MKVAMDLGLAYAICAGVAMLQDLLILDRVISTRYKETIDKHLCALLAFFAAFSLVDMIWGCLFSDVLPGSALWYEIFTYGFHAMSALSSFVWFGYIIYYTGMKGGKKVGLNVWRGVLIAVQLGVLISNLWTHRAFHFENGVYKTGLFRTISFCLQFSYYILIGIFFLLLLAGKKGGGDRSHYRNAVVYSIVPLFFGFLQMLFPDAAMYSLGFTFTAFAIYCFNVTAQRESFLQERYDTDARRQRSVIRALAGNYDTIYTIDIADGAYERYYHSEDGSIKASGGGEDFFAELPAAAERVVYEEDREALLEALSRENLLRELSDKEETSYTYRSNPGEDGVPRWHEMRCVRSDAAGENGIIIGVYNVDAEYREEAERQLQLQQAKEEAEAANEAKTTFLFNMSHDIRTPMNAILGFNDMARKHVDDKERVIDCLDKVNAAGEHLLSLINDVLDMARIESGKVELNEVPMNIREASRATMAIAFSSAEARGIKLTLHSSELGDRNIYGDSLRINQIALNIISNAVKYTNPGGRIDVYLEEHESDDPDRMLVDMVIEDTGIGMSEEFVAKIYEPFERAANTTQSGVQGTGLGMAITKSLVDMMGAKLLIESKLGVGTKVSVRFNFRLADADAVEKKAAPEDEGEGALAGKKVLLVEDNELNREIARDILEELGMIVEEAEDGTVAVKRCAEMIAAGVESYCDVILMDIQMPLMDGYKATREIRSMKDPSGLHVPIVAMTANAFDEDKQKAYDAGMDAHLAKPINIEELVKTLKRLL